MKATVGTNTSWDSDQRLRLHPVRLGLSRHGGTILSMMMRTTLPGGFRYLALGLKNSEHAAAWKRIKVGPIKARLIRLS